jgi:5-methylcytosine-specific restriction endonuclease McrA
MPILYACRRCGRPNPTLYCPGHEPVDRGPWAGGSTRAWRKLRAQILERDGGVCQLRLVCDGAPATHVDHIVPRIDGGQDTPENCRASCQPCNLSRGADRSDGSRAPAPDPRPPDGSGPMRLA